ncbi:bacillithiol biosynthesis deacetylase BshB1 [Marinigracilibium pacificum]|uniref:Bacillithiol biosynthesis deacetylase BshB1 n=1 Tax=Marinigracilibium pacificum TaxID=2729599 RepID=A0A848JBS4_9BACT|nr:bacillithiol biosynthesis deacetylase BshB1 [Marinigracilibium pacificum]NMM50452.1 bacillithiol biosynthesis deacetylase BshB1 [Marinigracilibium pacificum]
MKIDILAIAAHPDDVELSCAGTLLRQKSLGQTIGVLDLTRGELGTRGTDKTRAEEAAASSAILDLDMRQCLDLPDGFFNNSAEYQRKVIAAIRKYQPEIILTNAIRDRHPDHGKAATLVKDSAFLSGLIKIETFDEDGKLQEAWRPKKVYHFIQNDFIEPDFIVDISEFWETKIESIKAFKTQFFTGTEKEDDSEPETFISKPGFIEFIQSRAKEMGHRIGVKYGEGFTVNSTVGINDLNSLI